MMSLSLSLSLFLFVVSLSLSLPCVLSECTSCSSIECFPDQTCAAPDGCHSTCISGRTYDMYLICPPISSPPAGCPRGSCSDGDYTCYATVARNFLLSTVIPKAQLTQQSYLYVPETLPDQPGRHFQGGGDFWGALVPSPRVLYPTANAAADGFLTKLKQNTQCAQWTGSEDCASLSSVGDGSIGLYINISSIRNVVPSSTLRLMTCEDGTIVDASVESCTIDPVFATNTNNNGTNRTTQLLTIILPIVGGLALLLIITSIIAFRRYHAKQQVNTMIPLQGTSPSTQV